MKKGFTLIELLGILVVLGIVLTISLPNLLSVIKKNQENEYDNFVTNVTNAAQLYVETNRSLYNGQLINTGDITAIPVSLLISEGYVKDNLIDPSTEEAIDQNDSIIITLNSNKTLSYSYGNNIEFTLTDGEIITYGQYEYHYNQYYTGTGWYTTNTGAWGIKLTNSALTDNIIDTAMISKLKGKYVSFFGYLFLNSNATTIDLSLFDTSHADNMNYMFDNCTKVINLDLSTFDTTNVINMDNMFNGCSALTSLNVTNFNTSKVTSMYGMFKGCNHLTSLNLTSFDTTKVTNMAYMFNNCNLLTSITGTTSKWVVGTSTDITSMFTNCGVSSVTLS